MASRSAAVRTRDIESAATRRTILAAAEALLARGGEEGVSIRELCARAGVTPPTIYHHFGDKQALVARVVNDCFAEFDRALARRTAPADPVEALAWAFDRYIEYGITHPTHYRLMFERRGPRPTPAGLAAYDRLRRMVTAIAAAGRLKAPIEETTRACWCAAHGVTSLLVAGFFEAGDPAIALVRNAILTPLITPASPARSTRRPRRKKGARP